MAEPLTVGSVGRALFGEPESCPVCGGRLVPAFGQIVEGRTVRPVIDPTAARCEDCGGSFKVREPDAEQKT